MSLQVFFAAAVVHWGSTSCHQSLPHCFPSWGATSKRRIKFLFTKVNQNHTFPWTKGDMSPKRQRKKTNTCLKNKPDWTVVVDSVALGCSTSSFSSSTPAVVAGFTTAFNDWSPTQSSCMATRRRECSHPNFYRMEKYHRDTETRKQSRDPSFFCRLQWPPLPFGAKSEDEYWRCWQNSSLTRVPLWLMLIQQKCSTQHACATFETWLEQFVPICQVASDKVTKPVNRCSPWMNWST